jgi:hypothetical protein
MKKIILVFGLISGAISSALMIVTVPFADRIGHSLFLGYATMVASFLLVYFGIRSYRDNASAGSITFGKAFAIGICITLISCAMYVLTWEVIYFNFMHDFMDKYNAHVIAKLQESGATAAAVQAKMQQLNAFKKSYENIFFNMAMTFIEPFPVGLLITLISSAVLRKKPTGATAP